MCTTTTTINPGNRSVCIVSSASQLLVTIYRSFAQFVRVFMSNISPVLRYPLVVRKEGYMYEINA